MVIFASCMTLTMIDPLRCAARELRIERGDILPLRRIQQAFVRRSGFIASQVQFRERRKRFRRAIQRALAEGISRIVRRQVNDEPFRTWRNR